MGKSAMELSNATRVLFNNMDPKALTRARDLFVKHGDEKGWNGMVKVWLRDRFLGSLKEAQTGEVINTPGKIRKALYGDPVKRDQLRAALGPDLWPQFDRTMDALQTASRFPVSGSDTAFKQATRDKLQNRGISSMLVRPKAMIDAWLKNRNMDTAVLEIYDKLSNPANMARLKELRKLSPKSERFIQVVMQTLGFSAATHAETNEKITNATNQVIK
jgi:hypothetical protein